ncbi:flagellar biosynthesis protein FlhF [Deferribacterales bacterium RsTz2092]|nr:flagellar biosynthesis protein FlhF [Deferribacterales bacterium]
MQFKKYEVADMKEAIRIVKDDLGPDAVILSTRKVTKPASFGLLPRTVLEVTAALDYDGAVPKPAEQINVPIANMPRFGYGREHQAGTIIKAQQQAESTGADSDYINALLESTNKGDVVLANNLKAEAQKAQVEQMPQTPQIITPSAGATSDVDSDKLATVIKAMGLDKMAALSNDMNEIKQQLTNIQNALGDLSLLHVDLDDSLKALHSAMVNNGVDEIVSYRMLKGLEMTVPEAVGQAYLKSLVTDELTKRIPIEQDMASSLYRKVVAFVGPTGVGKTSTIVKLLAHIVTKYSQQRIALITSDNSRIGALEQLKTYADMVKAPVYLVSEPSELTSLLNEIESEYDYIFLDTAGHSPYNDSAVSDLSAMLEASNGAMTVLVLSMAGNQDELGNIYEKYAPLSPDYLLFTKLDETMSFGALANLPIKKNTPILMLSVGQNVPSDYEIPIGTKIAKKLLNDLPSMWEANKG